MKNKIADDIRVLFLTSFMMICALLIYPVCCRAQSDDVITNKTASILSDFLRSDNPAQFAKTHNIELKDSMIKVIMTVDEKLLPKDFASRYDLKEYKIRKNTASAYVKLDMFKNMLREPCVIFVRTPFKFLRLGK